MPSILSTDKKEGRCRICGKIGKLTKEHVIPRNAGGGEKVKLYNTTDVLEKGKNARYNIKQNGLAARTLCADCNNLIGREYDEDFGLFYKVINMGVNNSIKDLIEKGEIKDETDLKDKSLEFTIKKIRPFNIAQRILASFCSIDHENLVDRIPEIRKAILDPKYIPDAKDFSLYFSLKFGNDAFFATIAAIKTGGKTEAFAGIESIYTGFYLKEARLNEDYPDSLGKSLNITNWLTDFESYKEYDMKFIMPFVMNMALPIPLDK